MSNLYSEILLHHYHAPHNFGSINDPDVSIEDRNESCGDVVQMFMSISDKKGLKTIEDIKFIGTGCALSIASSSILTDYVKGKTIDEVERLTEDDLQKIVGIEVSIGRIKCLTMPLYTIQKGLKTIRK